MSSLQRDLLYWENAYKTAESKEIALIFFGAYMAVSQLIAEKGKSK